ncbi:hypothetical protein A6A27_32095 [Micromonospora sp. CB01531]|nr:hypothetical protein A6A27_32095 [Micromonospora sp. CB01531]
MDQAIGQNSKKVVDQVRKGMRELDKGRKGTFKDLDKEMQSFQKLEKQRKQSIAAEQKDQQRRLNELSAWYKKKQAIEKADAAESLKAAKQAQADMDKAFKYRTMRALGASPEVAAQAATGKSVKPGEIQSQFNAVTAAAKRSGIEVARAFDAASHTLSQLSTRLGLASFQLQLLGGFATTFLTGPAALVMGKLAFDGLKFATNVGYARASMEALLGPAADVEKVIREIQRIAIESPLFNTEDAISYAQKLASVGVKEKDLYKSMQALSNIFLTRGVAGPERASLALMAYTQILSKGAIGMDDLRQQFAEHVPDGINVFAEAAKILGYKTLDDLREAFKAGEVSAEQLNAAFIKLGNSPKYLSGATKAAATLGGVWQAFTEDIQARVGFAFDRNREEIIGAINAIRPVVLGLIDELIAGLPKLIDWLGRLIGKVRDIWSAYQALNPEQKELVRQVILLTLASGPAAIAIGIFGTALSGVANAASLAMKSLSLIGGPLAGMGGWIAVAVLAIGALMTALGVLYARSEKVRLGMLQAFNFIKDVIKDALLPAVDNVIGAAQSLEKTFGFLGFESKDLAQIFRLLAAPIYLVSIALSAVVLVIKVVQVAMLALTAIAYGLLHAVSFLLLGFQKLFEVVARFSTGDRKSFFSGLAKDLADWRKGVGGVADSIDIGKQWQGLTETNSKATEEWQNKLGNLDLTATGLSGVFGNWNGILDQTIDKQVSLKDAVNNARQAMQTQATTAMSAQNASDQWNKSLLALRDSIKQNKSTLDEKTKAGQANRDMLKAATQASYEMMLQDIASGVPMDLAIRRHRDRTNALKDEFGKSKETKAEAQKLIDTYGKVPKDVKTLLELMGFTNVAKQITEILAAQKVAANPGMSYQKALQAERKAWQFEKGEGLKNGGIGKKAGGEIRGPGGPTGDKIPIMASDQEYMIRAKAAKNLGKPALDYINRHGALPIGGMFAKGGQVNWPMRFDFSGTKFPEILGGSPNGGGMGWLKMMAVLRQQFPGLPLISGFRPGAITSTGNRSYHALGRAVDLPPSWDVFNWISQNYGKGTKELIFSPAGGRQIKNGAFHRFTGGTIEQDHWDHVHWAYDNGGYVAPNTPFINKTGANELALNAAQGKALEQKIADSDRPVNVTVYVDGVKRDAEIVFDEKAEELIKALGGV